MMRDSDLGNGARCNSFPSDLRESLSGSKSRDELRRGRRVGRERRGGSTEERSGSRKPSRRVPHSTIIKPYRAGRWRKAPTIHLDQLDRLGVRCGDPSSSSRPLLRRDSLPRQDPRPSSHRPPASPRSRSRPRPPRPPHCRPEGLPSPSTSVPTSVPLDHSSVDTGTTATETAPESTQGTTAPLPVGPS